jgi:DMSO reductase anchor subunit
MTPQHLSQTAAGKPTSADHPTSQTKPLFPVFVTSMIIGILMLISIIHLGFFHSYIKFFPRFEDANIEGRGPTSFTTPMHFHGVVMMGWVFMLLLQPILIRKRKKKLHRQVGRLSYVLAPLVLLSIFLVNKGVYHKVSNAAGESEAVATVALIFPAFVFFAILYFLAIRYRHRPALHMRFMCSTAFLFIPPALDRALIYYLHLPGYDVGSVIQLVIIGAVTTFDSVMIKRLSPFALVFAFEVLHKILWHSRESDFWQATGRLIAKMF